MKEKTQHDIAAATLSYKLKVVELNEKKFLVGNSVTTELVNNFIELQTDEMMNDERVIYNGNLESVLKGETSKLTKVDDRVSAVDKVNVHDTVKVDARFNEVTLDDKVNVDKRVKFEFEMKVDSKRMDNIISWKDVQKGGSTNEKSVVFVKKHGSRELEVRNNCCIEDIRDDSDAIATACLTNVPRKKSTAEIIEFDKMVAVQSFNDLLLPLFDVEWKQNEEQRSVYDGEKIVKANHLEYDKVWNQPVVLLDVGHVDVIVSDAPILAGTRFVTYVEKMSESNIKEVFTKQHGVDPHQMIVKGSDELDDDGLRQNLESFTCDDNLVDVVDLTTNWNSNEEITDLWFDERLPTFIWIYVVFACTLILENSANIVPTKQMPMLREVIEQMMTVFDPGKLLGPVFTRARLLLQGLWRCFIGWKSIDVLSRCEEFTG